MAGRQASTLAFAGLRLITMGLAWYLMATTAIGVILRGLGLIRWRRLADAVTLPGVRQLLAGAVGLSVSAASLMGTASQAGAVTGRGGPARWALPAVRTARLDPGSGAVMTRLPPAGSPTLARPPTPAGPPGTAGPPTPAAPTPSAATNQVPLPRTWVVRHGDNLWSVAQSNLARAWGRTPTDSEIDRYWLRLVEANRARLADPGNPDLIFAGQVFELPAP